MHGTGPGLKGTWEVYRNSNTFGDFQFNLNTLALPVDGNRCLRNRTFGLGRLNLMHPCWKTNEKEFSIFSWKLSIN